MKFRVTGFANLNSLQVNGLLRKLLLPLFFLPLSLSATVSVTATLTDPAGSPVKISFLRLELVRCGGNIPAVPTNPSSIVLKRIDLRPDPNTGFATGVVYGNDEIRCGGSQSTLYHVTAFSDSQTPIAGDKDYLLCASIGSGCGTPGTWNLATAQPFSGNLPAPGFQAVFTNPLSSQIIKQPVGTSLTILGNLDLTNANVIGFVGGGGGGSTLGVQVNATPITGTTINFGPLPPALAGSVNVTFQQDTNNPTNISGAVAYASIGQPGVMQLSGDFCAASTATLPQICSTHLSAPQTVAQGGTGQVTAIAAFNALAPSGATGSLLVATTPNVYGSLPPVSTVGWVLTNNGLGVIPSYQAPAGGGSGISPTPGAGVTQTVTQQLGTTLNVNSFNNLRFVVPSYNWVQSPADDLSSAGAHTINLAPCPLGVDTTSTWYFVFITGTGTPEAMKVTSGTCTPGAVSGTIIGTTLNAHTAGYTVGSASQGLQETSNEARYIPTNPTGASQAGHVIVPPGTYSLQARVSIRASSQTIDFSGSILECNMSDTCVFVGNPADTNAFTDITLNNLRLRPMVVNGTFPGVEIQAQNTKIHGINTRNGVATASFGYMVQVDNDQGFDLSGMDATGNGSTNVRCDATFCGAAVFNPANQAGVGYIHNNTISMSCKGNGIDWQGGNTLHVQDSVVQAYNQYGIRARSTFSVNPSVSLDNVYEEVGNCTNPLGTGTAGIILQNGRAEIHGGQPGGAVFPRYANTGATQYNYYVVPLSSTTGASTPLLAGTALTNGAGTIPVVFNQVAEAAGVTTFDVLRTSGALDVNYTFPYTAICAGGTPTACGSRATGLTTAACTAGVCTFNDDAAANTASYTVNANPQAGVPLTLWPGSIVLTEGANLFIHKVSGNSTNVISSFNGTSAGPQVFADQCSRLNLGGVWQSCLRGDSVVNSFAAIGAWVRQIGINGGGASGLKGIEIFGMSGPLGSLPAGDLITLGDSNFQKTIATPNFRPTSDANDTAIGLDQTSFQFPSGFQLAFRAPVAISNYIANIGDGSNWKERLTSNTKSFQNVALTVIGTGTVNFNTAAHTLNARAGTVAAIPATCTFTAGSALEVYLATDATAGQNWYFCTATNVWTQQINTGGGAAMSTSMSNAAAIAIPNGVDLKPATAGGMGLGTVALPFSTAFFGTAATNNHQLAFTGATASRVHTFQDNTGTVAELNVASQTFSALQIFSTGANSSFFASTTANSSTLGDLRLPPTGEIRYGSSNFILVKGGNAGPIQVGDTAGAGFAGVITSTSPALGVAVQPAAATGNGTGTDLSLSGALGAGTGGNGNIIVTPGTGGSGAKGLIQLEGAVTTPVTNNGVSGTTINSLASYTSAGQAVVTPSGSASGLAGICAKNCSTSGTAEIVRLGTFALNLDNTGTPGDYVCISSTTAGFGHDCALSPNTQVVGVVRSAVSGTLYNVDVSVGSSSAGGGSAFAVVTNPAATATNTIQPSGAAVVAMTVKAPAGAAGGLVIFQVLDNTGAVVFSCTQSGSCQQGSGVTGTITASGFISANSPPALTGIVRLADLDAIAWRNHANGADISMAKGTNDTVTLGTVFAATQLSSTLGTLDLVEGTAPSGSATHDFIWGDSTNHWPGLNANNVGNFRLAAVSQVNIQAGTTYTVTTNDFLASKVINFTNAGAIAVTLPQSTGVLANNACITVNAAGAGTATLTPTTSTINGGANVAIASGKFAKVCADNSGGNGNYLAIVGISTAGAGDMIKNAANTMGASGTLDGRSMSVTAGFALPSGAGASPTAAAFVSYDSTLNLPVFGNGTTTVIFGGRPFNAQTGTSYTILTTDRNKFVTFSNASPVAVTLPQSGASFPNGWFACLKNIGAGTATITPTTSTIDGSASKPLVTNESVCISSDGTNYRSYAHSQDTFGTVTSIATSAPLSGGTITTSGTLSCPTCTTNAAALTNNQLVFGAGSQATAVGDLTGDVTTAGGKATTIAALAVTAAKSAAVLTRRVCSMAFGDTSGAVLTNGQLGPQKRLCFIPAAATVVEVDVAADAGTPNIIVGKNTANTQLNFLSAALATAGSGGIACSNTGGTTGLDGATTCSATLQNTSLALGAYVEAVSGTAGGVAKLMTVQVIYTIN